MKIRSSKLRSKRLNGGKVIGGKVIGSGGFVTSRPSPVSVNDRSFKSGTISHSSTSAFCKQIITDASAWSDKYILFS